MDLGDGDAARRPAAPIGEIAHFVPSFGRGGAERVAADLALWARRSARVRVIAPLGGDAAQTFVDAGLPVEGARVRRPNDANRADMLRVTIDAAIRLRDAKLVHATLAWPDRLGAALVARGRAPMAVTFQLLQGEDERFPRDWIFPTRRLSPAFVRASARLAPLAFVALSKGDRARLEEAFPGVRVVVVPNAPPPPDSDACPTLPFGAGVRVLAVGRLHRQKGFERLIDALARPPASAHEFSLCIVGGGEESERLATSVRESPIASRVQLVGALPAARVYAQADLFVTTSRAEGMPLALLEAMSAGVAVLASPIPAHREVLEGIDGALLSTVEADWPAQIAALLASPELRRRVAGEARARALGLYSLDVQREAYARLYDELR
ncbi:MAG TPA: glycosyltransferase family 4 protein [Byssovorax sp.]